MPKAKMEIYVIQNRRMENIGLELTVIKKVNIFLGTTVIKTIASYWANKWKDWVKDIWNYL